MSAPPALPERPGASPTHMNIDREMLKLMRPGRIGGNRRCVCLFFRECWCACPSYEYEERFGGFPFHQRL